MIIMRFLCVTFIRIVGITSVFLAEFIILDHLCHITVEFLIVIKKSLVYLNALVFVLL